VRSDNLLKEFQAVQPWPPTTSSPYFGTEGSLGLHSRDAFRLALPLLPPWPSCDAFIAAITTPWPLKEQQRLRSEGFFGWNAEARYPSDELHVEECASWPDAWAVVVPEANWWAFASLLNGRLSPAVMSDATEGKPDVIEVRVGTSSTYRVHVRGILVDVLHDD
jgi:hypothetical protein